MYQKLEGFKQFADTGYYDLIEKLKHDVCDAFLTNPNSRSQDDLHLMLDYCKKYLPDYFKHVDF